MLHGSRVRTSYCETGNTKTQPQLEYASMQGDAVILNILYAVTNPNESRFWRVSLALGVDIQDFLVLLPRQALL